MGLSLVVVRKKSGVGGKGIGIELRKVRTDEELEHAWILDFAAPVGALEAVLLRYCV